ncbi:hypothetical protein SISSUDRAFT_1054254 [Sistotremastrum suecicum HHB10207 ss-3]|uniref:Uncharacterized protein n=1 Tax=Sistotremastrum suecicum HHB10207 ss-3 TaxID=1314776 RepID=A0A165YNB4_9AGAM|nr:hypothetical protein SISSUDRAFT_1054254 [Sistotremastrum suecicum HHB10207 ss-3]
MTVWEGTRDQIVRRITLIVATLRSPTLGMCQHCQEAQNLSTFKSSGAMQVVHAVECSVSEQACFRLR